MLSGPKKPGNFVPSGLPGAAPSLAPPSDQLYLPPHCPAGPREDFGNMGPVELWSMQHSSRPTDQG
jgi:hypothetical protein